MEKKLPSRIRRKRNIKIKKSTVGIFVAVFAFVTSLFYAFAGEKPTITVSSIDSASRGDQVTLNIDLANNETYSILSYSINFDKEMLEYVDDEDLSFAEATSNNGSGKPYYNVAGTDLGELENGKVLFYHMFDGKTANSDNHLGQITFKVKNNASGKINITLSDIVMGYEDENGDTTEITVDTVDGYVNVLVPVDQNSVKLSKTTYEIQKNQNDTLNVEFSPADTTDSKKFTYTSSDDNIVSVDNTGKMTANAVGNATITVNAFGKSLTAEVSVVNHITKVNVTGSKTQLNKSETLELTATVEPTDTSDSKTLTWDSSNKTAATVDSNGVVTAKAGGETTITATSVNGVVGSYTIKVVVPITEFTTTDVEFTLNKGENKKINTTITPEDTTEDKTITWTTSDETVATVSSDGTVSAISGGNATITGTLKNGKKVESRVKVVVPIQKVELDKSNLEMTPGQKQTIKEIITPEDTTENKSVTWTSSDDTIATVKNGEVTAVAPGNATITATVGTRSVNANVRVLIPIDNVAISESEVTLNRNATKKLNVIITPENAEEDKTVTWTSSDPSSVSVSDDGTIKGLKGTQSPVTITGTLKNGKKVESKVTVIVAIESIELNKNSTTINKGANETLTVTINPEDTSEDTTVTWTSSDDTIATVDSNGKVIAIAAGTATITAKVGTFEKNCAVSVVVPIDSVTVLDADFTLNRGDNKTVTATVNPSDTTEDKTVTWTSSNAAVAKVDSNGKVTAIAAGTATITAKVGTKTDTVKVTVIVPITEFITTDTTFEIIKNSSKTINTTINPSDTTEDKTITWTSADKAIATVDETGKVTGVAAGTVKITGTLKNGKKVESTVTVKIIPVESIEIIQDKLDMKRKDTKVLNVEYKPENATEATDIVWSSSDEEVAIVDENGKVTALKEGTATITAKMGNLTDTIDVTVTEVPLKSIILDDDSTKVGKDYKISVKLDPIDATDDITYEYSSSDEEIATVDEFGNVTTKKAGKVKITVKASNGTDEFEDSFELTVNTPDSPKTGQTPIWVYGSMLVILLVSAIIIVKKKELF